MIVERRRAAGPAGAVAALIFFMLATASRDDRRVAAGPAAGRRRRTAGTDRGRTDGRDAQTGDEGRDDDETRVEALCGDLSAVRAPRGTKLNARSWQTEAPLRMLLNNLDPEVAEHPEELVVYGGSGRAARSHQALQDIVRTLLRLRDDETLLVQSRKAGRRVPHPPGAPRVLIANSLLVPKWATWDEFRRLEAEGLTMFGQMTAGSWIYIGTQGILQGTYQTFCAAGEVHFGSADLRGANGAHGGPRRHGRRPAARGDDGGRGDPLRRGRSSARSTGGSRRATSTSRPARSTTRSRGCAPPRRRGGLCRWRCSANAADVFPELVARGEHFDLVTDQTAAHDPLTGYVPAEVPFEEAAALRARDPKRYLELASQSIVAHCRAMCDFVRMGCYVFDYGNNLRGEAYAGGLSDAFSYPGFVPAYIRPLFCRGIGPFRWAVLSGDPADIEVIDRELQALFPDDVLLQRWLEMAPEKVAFQGLPARICWLGYGDRARAGLAINELVRAGRVSAPVVIGRDHLDSGSVASPYRETEAMMDGSDAIADWPILNALRQHGRRRDVGERAPRRRCRDRQLDPQRHGRGGRRHDRRGGAPRAGAHGRPRHGRDAPCRRRLRGGARRRARRWARPAERDAAAAAESASRRRRRRRQRQPANARA